MGYPVEYEIEYPEHLSRWMWLVKWLLAIPHFIILDLFGSLAFAVAIISGFSLLFTGRYPAGLFDLVAAYLRWQTRTAAYLFLRDEYPPFSGAEEPQYPVRVRVERPEGLSRWMWLVKWLLAIPHLIVLVFYGILALVLVIIGLIALLFTGRFPKGLFDLIVGFSRWALRVQAYALYLLTDQYPPFSGRPAAEV
ncbi:MAG TPA: DUF4389 domain-containing protein [Dehalococcoidia bacterium]|nr:DUF4389 domain-containing protein [Dehalococcoidia bacterium]